MQKSFLKTFITTTVALTLLLTSALISQPPDNKAKERVKQIKKIKLLEILELDEPSSEKFLAKYTVWEKKIEDKMVNLDNAIEDLHSSLRKNDSKDVITNLTNKATLAQKDMMNILFDAQNDFKSILNETQFAKLVVFEHKFKDEMQKIIMDRMRNGGGKKFKDR